MNKVEVVVFDRADGHEKAMMGLGARITQKGHEIRSVGDLAKMVSKPVSDTFMDNMCSLPHPTLQKLSTIEVVFIGVSRRFLAQITRHQDMKFMSSSFQYGDHSETDFFTPIEILRGSGKVKQDYATACLEAKAAYKEVFDEAGRDAAGYLLPQATRVTLMASATMYQWKHVISQRICRRNTPEIRYVMGLLWSRLYQQYPVVFSPKHVGPDCMHTGCQEGKMQCGDPIIMGQTPDEFLLASFGDID